MKAPRWLRQGPLLMLKSRWRGYVPDLVVVVALAADVLQEQTRRVFQRVLTKVLIPGLIAPADTHRELLEIEHVCSCLASETVCHRVDGMDHGGQSVEVALDLVGG